MDPLTLNPTVFQAAATGHVLTQQQLKSIRRMVRDSPMLDFLNFAIAGPRKSRSSSRSEDPLLRSIIELRATDELLQELVGDKDDLQNLISTYRSIDKSMDNNKNVTFIDSDKTDTDGSSISIEHNENEELTKSSIAKSDKETLQKNNNLSVGKISKKRDLRENTSSHHRSKRGIKRWIRKLFGKKDPNDTTTTPSPPTEMTTTIATTLPTKHHHHHSFALSSSSSSSSEEKKKKRKHKHNHSHKKNKTRNDNNIDTTGKQSYTIL
jgi:hypothetical protein